MTVYHCWAKPLRHTGEDAPLVSSKYTQSGTFARSCWAAHGPELFLCETVEGSCCAGVNLRIGITFWLSAARIWRCTVWYWLYLARRRVAGQASVQKACLAFQTVLFKGAASGLHFPRFGEAFGAFLPALRLTPTNP